MELFNLFCRTEANKEVVIKDECERELFKGNLDDVSMKYANFKVYKVIDEDDIIIIYI